MSEEKQEVTSIELEDTEAAIVFSEKGVNLYLPNFEDSDEVPFYVILAAAIAARAAKDKDFSEQMINWFKDMDKSLQD